MLLVPFMAYLHWTFASLVLLQDGRLSAHSASGAQRAELTLQPMALLPLRRWLAASDASVSAVFRKGFGFLDDVG